LLSFSFLVDNIFINQPAVVVSFSTVSITLEINFLRSSARLSKSIFSSN
jgi:hypothetical protein